MSRILKIVGYEIDDASLDAENIKTVSIPCATNPGLSCQLDGWDQETSVPVWIDGRAFELLISHYDKQQNSWVLNNPA